MRTEVIGRGGLGDAMFVPRPGFIVSNRYELTEVIGRGGMGEVWKAHDRELDSPCAVKFIVQHLANDRGIRDRFSREAKAVARLRSPHVVHILGVGEVDNIPYLAMELLDGETLLTRLERIGRLHPAVTLLLIEQVAEALESAHHAGIVHRDLKPDNIWFWSGNKVFVKVLDFGVAKTGLTTESLQTATGALVGTPQYMSPEQALGNRDVDHRSDLWSLAVITMECLSGRRAFDSTGLGDLLLKIVGAPGPTVQDLAPHLPASLQDWWTKALARDPRDRFQSASELVNALRPHLAEFEPRSGQVPISGSARSSWLPSEGGPMRSGPEGSGPRPRVGTDPGVHAGALQPLGVSTAATSGSAISSPAISAPAISAPAISVLPVSAGAVSAPQQSSASSAASPSAAGYPESAAADGWGRRAPELTPKSAGPGFGSAREAWAAPSMPAPSLGSVGPLSSTRSRAPQSGTRRRTLLVVAALLAVGAVVTLGRMFWADDVARPASVGPTPSAEIRAANVPAEAAKAPQAAPAETVGNSPAPAPGQPGSALAPAAEPSPWDQALRRTGKPPETQSAVETLQPRPQSAAPAPAKPAINVAPTAGGSHAAPSAAASSSASPRSAAPHPPSPASAAAVPAAGAPATKKPVVPAPIGKPSAVSPSAVSLPSAASPKAPPPAHETPETEAAKKQRTDKLKRMIGL